MEDRTKVCFTHLANQFFLCTAFVPRAKLCILPVGLAHFVFHKCLVFPTSRTQKTSKNRLKWESEGDFKGDLAIYTIGWEKIKETLISSGKLTIIKTRNGIKVLDKQ